MDCDALNAENARLLAAKADLKSPLLSSNTDDQREAEITQVNAKLYTVAKAQFDKGCPAAQRHTEVRLHVLGSRTSTQQRALCGSELATHRDRSLHMMRIRPFASLGRLQGSLLQSRPLRSLNLLCCMRCCQTGEEASPVSLQ